LRKAPQAKAPACRDWAVRLRVKKLGEEALFTPGEKRTVMLSV
jgi:hypothetical protein